MTDGPERLMQADETLSPVDLPGDGEDAPGGLRWNSIIVALAALFLLFLNAATIDGWAKELPPGPAAARLTRATAGWAAFTDRLRLGVPRAALHGVWKRGQAVRFADRPEGAPAPDTSPPSP